MRSEILNLVYKYTDNGMIRGKILDVGGAGQDYQKEQGYNFRDYFREKNYEYFMLDNRDVSKVDFLCDATSFNKPDTFDAIICTEMLEHCLSPYDVMLRNYENLKNGGFIIVTVPYKYHVHCVEDYYRFTENGLKMLCSKFKMIEFGEFGVEEEYYFIGTK